METVKKYWLWGVFISILSLFAMSHNANAITPVINMNNYENIAALYPEQTCLFTDNTTSVGFGCEIPAASKSLMAIYFNTTVNVKKYDLLHFYILINTKNTDYPSDAFKILSLSAYQYPLRLKHIELVNSDVLGLDSAPNDLQINGYNISRIYEVVLEATNDANNVYVGLGGTRGTFIYQNGFYGSILQINLNAGLNQYRFVGSEENREVEEKTQDAVDESEAAGGSSSQSAQSGTTGLLNAITGAVNVISSASPTNCKINGNMGNLDIGLLDLCANPAPAFIQTIGSLILILMCVPLAISLFNRFITIFRSFQN